MSGTEETSVYTDGHTINGNAGDAHNATNCTNGDYDMDSFLFTSESVGEGHPGIRLTTRLIFI